MDLFDHARQERIQTDAPLAARMRPRTLDDFVGQEHIVGPGRLLRRAIQADQLSSLIFYGPPGTGKTTLARVIANTTKAHFIALNAVLAGVKDIREAIAGAQEQMALYGQRTILFVDEVHRFNKSQQDALLPWVENGTVIFVGATTENPYFEVNKALVSRSRIFQLQSLEKESLRRIAQQALADPDRGFGKLEITLDDDALDHLVEVANGDARGVLNALELAVETTLPGPSDTRHITLAIAEESIQRRAVLYDKEGDYHFDTISAFIKSLRGSDPDAAMYWMGKMIYAGEDPRFIFRRMVIFASEDVGLADPQAVGVVMSCAEAFDRIGMPEGRFPLAQAGLYLATAPKSNSAFALFDAIDTVGKEPEGDVPNHLKDGNRDKEGFGHGEGYLYPHAYRDHWVAQQYLPTAMQGKVFYQPSDQGYEATIRTQVARRREAQLAAMLEQGSQSGPGEILTYSPADPARDRWLQRTVSQAGERLAALRDRVLDQASLARHSTVLDLHAGSGLLTWEALRRAPEGGVFALAHTAQDAEALTQQADRLDPMARPVVLSGGLTELASLLAQSAEDGADLRFDAVVGRNALMAAADKAAAVETVASLLTPGGIISLVERVPRHTQRLYRLVDLGSLGPDVAQGVVQAEEALYADGSDPLVNWDRATLQLIFQQVGTGQAGDGGLAVELETVELETEMETVEMESQDEVTDMLVTATLLDRWFTRTSAQAKHRAAQATPTTWLRISATSKFERWPPSSAANSSTRPWPGIANFSSFWREKQRATSNE